LPYIVYSIKFRKNKKGTERKGKERKRKRKEKENASSQIPNPFHKH
jgi:hypothetical protein